MPTTPTASEFFADFPEFAPRANGIYTDAVVQKELDRSATKVSSALISDSATWQEAVMVLTAHYLELRRGSATHGGRGGGGVTSRATGNVSSSYATSGVPDPYNSTSYGVRFYSDFVAPYGCLRFVS